MSGYTRYGYGDEQTFPPCYGHPNDPRTDDDEIEPIHEKTNAEVWRDIAKCRLEQKRRADDDFGHGMAVIQQIMTDTGLTDSERRWAAYGVWRFFTARHGATAEHAQRIKESLA